MSQRSSLLPLALAVLAGFAGGIFSQQLTRPAQAASSAQVVTARDFRLVDASGKLLAELSPRTLPSKKVETQLVVYGSNGYQTSLGDGGLYFGKGYGNENIGIGYAFGSSGKLSPCIFFWFNKKGRMGFILDADKGGAPSAWMYDSNGKDLWRVPASPSP